MSFVSSSRANSKRSGTVSSVVVVPYDADGQPTILPVFVTSQQRDGTLGIAGRQRIVTKHDAATIGRTPVNDPLDAIQHGMLLFDTLGDGIGREKPFVVSKRGELDPMVISGGDRSRNATAEHREMLLAEFPRPCSAGFPAAPGDIHVDGIEPHLMGPSQVLLLKPQPVRAGPIGMLQVEWLTEHGAERGAVVPGGAGNRVTGSCGGRKSSAALKTANDRVRKLRRLTLKCFGMPPPFRVIILSFPFRVGLGLFVAYRLATGYGPLVPFPVVGGVEDWDYRLGVVQEPCHQGVESRTFSGIFWARSCCSRIGQS